MVKSILAEVNMYNEAPEAFADIFNVKKLLKLYSVYEYFDGEYKISRRETNDLYPLPPFSVKDIGEDLDSGWTNYGEITKIISEDTLEVIKNDNPIIVKIETVIRKNDTYK